MYHTLDLSTRSGVNAQILSFHRTVLDISPHAHHRSSTGAL